MLSCDTCVDRFWYRCDGGLRGVKVRPVRDSGNWFVWAACPVTMWWVGLLTPVTMWLVGSLAPVTMWWVCGCRSKWVSGTDNSLTSSVMLCRVSSFTLDITWVSLFADAFSKEALIPACCLRSEFPDKLVTSRPEDALIDLIANSILGATILFIAVRIAFCILSSTVSTILFISLSILSLKNLPRVLTFIAFHLSTELLLKVPRVKSRSLEPSLTTIFSCLSLAALPITKSWSKSSNWLRSLLFDCLFLQVETVFVLITELFLRL